MSRIISQFWRSFAYLLYLSICIEVGLQGFYYVTAGDFLFRRIALPIYASEPHAGYGNRPGLSFDHRTKEFHAHYFINKAGYRVPRPDVEYTVAKPNIYRVIILGPSFAFGWGVDYEFSFAGVLQQSLQERGFAREKKIEVINAGIPAMPLAPQLAWFEQVGQRYEPDLVIQFVYGSMAVNNVSEPPYTVNDQGYLVSLNAEGGWRYWRERFKNFATVFYGWVLWTKLNTAHPPVQLEEKGDAVLGAGREMVASTDLDPIHPEVHGAMHVYTHLADVVRAAGAQLLVVYFPRSYVIHSEDASRWQNLGMLDIKRQMAFDGAFVHYLNECGIPSIDLTQQLQKSAQVGKRMYYWLDIHWTAAGNNTAARAVADYLVGRP